MNVEIDYRKPFALCSLPGSKQWHLSTGTADSGNYQAYINSYGWQGFFINFFGNREPFLAGIEGYEPYHGQPISGEELREMEYAVKAQPSSITEQQHKQRVLKAVRLLRRHAPEYKKVVLARVEAIKISTPPHQVLEMLSEAYPATFRYLCNLPQTGIWLAATPEVLADYDGDTNELNTMALAGTKHQEEEWDQKNRQEQRVVADFIVRKLDEAGFMVRKLKTRDLEYGLIKHLCTPIKAAYNPASDEPVNVESLFRNLSPTPAVCGEPIEAALSMIRRYETIPRHCYGGFVGVKTGNRVRAFVNLRCALATPTDDGEFLYNIYSGGGITPMSDPQNEWDETVAKSQVLRDCIIGRVL